MEKNLSKVSQILILEDIALAAMLYFKQAFTFCMLIKKNVLGWFLLITCKEHAPHRSTKIFSRNHPTLYFWLIREGLKMPNTEQLATLSSS